MTELKPLDIAHEFIQRLLNGNTGTREEFAQLLGISPSWVTVYKRKIERLYKVEINYCRRRQSYLLNEKDHSKLPPLFRIVINCTLNFQESVGILKEIIFVGVQTLLINMNKKPVSIT